MGAEGEIMRLFSSSSIPFVLAVAISLATSALKAADCNRNGVEDDRDLSEGTSLDCNSNGVPDECDLLPSSLDFEERKDFRTGDSPECVVTADFNQDGILDLATANSLFRDISLLLGNGDGTFEGHLIRPAGGSCLLALDLNRDGIPDIVEPGVFVLLGKGEGTFRPPQRVSAKGGATILGADLNGDGAVDVALSSSDAITILLGNGNGTFKDPQSVSGSFSTTSMIAPDLNGDGILDLVLTNYALSVVSVLPGNGDGTFKEARDFPTRDGDPVDDAPTSVVAADLNRDGLLDLVTANNSSETVAIFLGKGDGSFQPPRVIPAGVPCYLIAASDLDGDGILDLATSPQGGNAGGFV